MHKSNNLNYKMRCNKAVYNAHIITSNFSVDNFKRRRVEPYIKYIIDSMNKTYDQITVHKINKFYRHIIGECIDDDKQYMEIENSSYAETAVKVILIILNKFKEYDIKWNIYFHVFWPIKEENREFVNEQIKCLLLISKNKNKFENKSLRALSKVVTINIIEFLVYFNSEERKLKF